MAIELFTAQKILELAFGAIVETGVGKLTEGAIIKGQQLWTLIRNRLQGKPVTEAAIVEIEQNHSRESLQQLIPFLQVEMSSDPPFAQEIQTLAQQVNLGSQENIVMNVDARDNAAVLGKAEGETQFFGGTHYHEGKKN